MRFVVGFFRFWWDFVIGDDWRIAAGVAAVLGIGAVLVGETGLSDTAVSLITGLGVLTVVMVSIFAGAVSSIRGR